MQLIVPLLQHEKYKIAKISWYVATKINLKSNMQIKNAYFVFTALVLTFSPPCCHLM
jgi:hypothetical protein